MRIFRRGDLELREIILLIIGLVVLITVIYAFRTQIGAVMDKLFGISESIDTQGPLDALLR